MVGDLLLSIPETAKRLALQWRDINFGELTMRVTRGVVDGVVDEVKTEYSFVRGFTKAECVRQRSGGAR
jgi:hypothetical protein